MKERYTKPSFSIELFTMTESIASSCGGSTGDPDIGPTHSDIYSCGYREWEEIYWLNTDNCTSVVDEYFETEVGCYNAPNGGTQIFAS